MMNVEDIQLKESAWCRGRGAGLMCVLCWGFVIAWFSMCLDVVVFGKLGLDLVVGFGDGIWVEGMGDDGKICLFKSPKR